MREPKDIIIDGKTLDKILDQHKNWLNVVGGTRAELRGAYLRGADLQGVDLRDANLRDANLQYADLRDADLQSADLQSAELQGAKLQRADLRDAELQGAKLQRAELQRADLQGADLRDAKLDFSQLNLACVGLNFKIDERIAKQLMYHVINLMQYSNLDVNKIVKKHMFKWLEDSHLVNEHHLPKLKDE